MNKYELFSILDKMKAGDLRDYMLDRNLPLSLNKMFASIIEEKEKTDLEQITEEGQEDLAKVLNNYIDLGRAEVAALVLILLSQDQQDPSAIEKALSNMIEDRDLEFFVSAFVEVFIDQLKNMG